MELPKLFINVSVDNEKKCKCILKVDETVDNQPFEVSNTIKEYSTNGQRKIVTTNEPASQPSESSSKCLSIPTNILLIKPFIDELKESQEFRLFVYKYFNAKLKKYSMNDDGKSRLRLILKTSPADSYVIDYAWGWRLWRECHLGLERDLASAWLSTLGGAFSALGDNSSKCAEMALRISLQQVRLSATTGDEDGVARGCLFLALALSQLNHGRSSRILLHNAISRSSSDPRHRAMCLGVQAKLKYDSKLRRLARKKRREEKRLRKAKLAANDESPSKEVQNNAEDNCSRVDAFAETNEKNIEENNTKDNINGANKNALWDLLMSLKL